MARYNVKDPSGQTHVIEGPDDATPDQIIEQAQRLIPSGQPQAQPSLAQNISSYARPALETLGSMGGAIAGAGVGIPTGPGAIASSIAGGGLGYAAGRQAANILDEYLKVRQTPPLSQQFMNTAKDTAVGATGQALGLGMGAGMSAVGKGLTKVQAAISGAKASDLQRAAVKGYSTYSAPSMDEASAGFGKALQKEGINTTPSLESTLDPQLAQARDTALKYGKKLDGGSEPLPAYVPRATKDPHAVFQGNFDLGEGNKYSTYIIKGDHPRTGGNFGKEDIQSMGIPIVGAEGKGIGQLHDLAESNQISAQEALQGRQAVDRIIAGTPQKDKPTLLALGNLRDRFSEALSKLSPDVQKASGDYADAILKRNLTKVMPVNKSGEYSKLAPYLAAAAGSAVGYGHHDGMEGVAAGGGYLLGTSPLAMGLAATTLGSISPQVRNAALASFVDRVITKSGH